MRFQFNAAGLIVRDFGNEKSKDYAKWQKVRDAHPIPILVAMHVADLIAVHL
jgi:hypothetical protein